MATVSSAFLTRERSSLREQLLQNIVEHEGLQKQLVTLQQNIEDNLRHRTTLEGAIQAINSLTEIVKKAEDSDAERKRLAVQAAQKKQKEEEERALREKQEQQRKIEAADRANKRLEPTAEDVAREMSKEIVGSMRLPPPAVKGKFNGAESGASDDETDDETDDASPLERVPGPREARSGSREGPRSGSHEPRSRARTHSGPRKTVDIPEPKSYVVKKDLTGKGDMAEIHPDGHIVCPCAQHTCRPSAATTSVDVFESGEILCACGEHECDPTHY